MRIALLVACLLAAACVTETTTVDGTRSPPPRRTEPESRPDRDPGETVKIPPEVMTEIIAFVNRRHFLIADRIEVDFSRIPFQSSMVPVGDPRFVETVEMGSTEENAIGILLRSRSRRPIVERDFPRIRMGDGFELIAHQEIRVRTYNRIDRERPVFLRIQGVGHAVYRDEESGRRIEKDAISIRTEVREERGELRFSSKVL